MVVISSGSSELLKEGFKGVNSLKKSGKNKLGLLGAIILLKM